MVEIAEKIVFLHSLQKGTVMLKNVWVVLFSLPFYWTKWNVVHVEMCGRTLLTAFENYHFSL